MSKPNLSSWGVGNPRYLDWCLQQARWQMENDFVEVRQFPSLTAQNYVRFVEACEPPKQWKVIEGLIYRGLASERYLPEHKELWQQFRAFSLRERSRVDRGIFRKRGVRGSKLLEILKDTWDTEQFGRIVWQDSEELRAQMTEQGWRLDTCIVFDRSLLKYYNLYDPDERLRSQQSAFLGWLGLGGSEWDDARRGTESEIAEQVRSLLGRYSKQFLQHFSRQT